MRWLSGGGLLLAGCTILLLTGWDIFQSFGPAYEPTTIFSSAGHGPIEILWVLYAAVAAPLVWVGIRVLRAVREG